MEDVQENEEKYNTTRKWFSLLNTSANITTGHTFFFFCEWLTSAIKKSEYHFSPAEMNDAILGRKCINKSLRVDL